MLANQASSTPPITAASSDQVMQDGAGRLWTSLGQAPALQMAWRRLPAFRSDMRQRTQREVPKERTEVTKRFGLERHTSARRRAKPSTTRRHKLDEAGG